MSIRFDTSYPLAPAFTAARSASGDSTLIKGKLSREAKEGLYPAFSASGQDVWHHEYRHEGTAIILSAVGARCGKCFFARERWSAIANTHVIWPNSETVDPEYLFLLLNNERFWVRGGSAQPFVKVKESLRQNIPLPDLLEQQRIVTRVKECIERVEEIDDLRKEGNKEYAALTRSYLSETYRNLLGRFPTEKLSSLGDVFGGGTPSKQNADFWSGDIPWISPKDMKQRYLSDASLHISQDAIEGSSAKLISSQSVLFVVRGMILIHTLPVAVNTVPVAINQDMKAITPSSDIAADFLAAMIRGAEQQLLSKVEVAGHGTRRLQTQHWASLAIPVPPVAEQEKIIEEINAFENSISQLKKDVSGKDPALLRDSVLQKAFAGKL
jgi:type I restriction enzyme S subunit